VRNYISVVCSSLSLSGAKIDIVKELQKNVSCSSLLRGLGLGYLYAGCLL
jgi:hypothetical protein